jgi:hypothetical protein
MNAEGRRPLGKPRCRWKDNIKMDLRYIEWGAMDWIHPAQHVEGSSEHGIDKMLGNAWVAERLATSQGLSSMELVKMARRLS